MLMAVKGSKCKNWDRISFTLEQKDTASFCIPYYLLHRCQRNSLRQCGSFRHAHCSILDFSPRSSHNNGVVPSSSSSSAEGSIFFTRSLLGCSSLVEQVVDRY
ncbi:hypothetical protein K1719_005204 [Acacia pycnantha]|nr:hypothetical protein K1719_005204 [Acacia pycnantha]